MIPRILGELGSMASLDRESTLLWDMLGVVCQLVASLPSHCSAVGLMPANMCAYARQRHKARRTSRLLVMP